jgi:hypothetical protein
MKQRALNIVVGCPCWKYGGTDMLRFEYFVGGIKKSKSLDGIIEMGQWSKFMKRC